MEKKIYETRSKIAVFYEGKQISTYKYSKIIESGDYLIAYNSTLLTIYYKGTRIFSKNVSVYSVKYPFIYVTKNECTAVYDYNGNIIVPFDSYGLIVTGYHDSLIVTKHINDLLLEGVYRRGTCIVPIEFDSAIPEYNGIRVRNEKLLGAYSYDGTLIVPVDFNEIVFCEKGIRVFKNGLCGAYSYDGTLIVPVEFDDIVFDILGIKVCKNDLWGAYSYDGRCIAPTIFFDIRIDINGNISVLRNQKGSYEAYKEQ